MRHLADDAHHGVLVALASNPNVPHEVADRLANHRRADVRNAAMRRFERRDEPVERGPSTLTRTSPSYAIVCRLRRRWSRTQLDGARAKWSTTPGVRRYRA